jgi:cell division protein FtsL
MATKKKTAKTTKAASPGSKKKTISKQGSDFWKVQFTINTVYWLVIGLAVIATAVLTYNTNQQISDLYDSIDVSNLQADSSVPPKSTVKPSN